jgi:N6-L-threonylcarbamoyladenine synthase
VGQEDRKIFTYSGVKTAMNRLVELQKPLTSKKVYDLAASFQNIAFEHLVRVVNYIINHNNFQTSDLLVGGGVCANIELRKRLRKMANNSGIKVRFPYSKRLTGDNAAMIGLAGYFKYQREEFSDPDTIDRIPNLKI